MFITSFKKKKITDLEKKQKTSIVLNATVQYQYSHNHITMLQRNLDNTGHTLTGRPHWQIRVSIFTPNVSLHKKRKSKKKNILNTRIAGEKPNKMQIYQRSTIMHSTSIKKHG